MTWLNLLGGLGVLLYGMRTTSEAVQALAGERLRETIGRISERRLDALGTGLLVSLIVQSSALTTVMVVSFVNAGLMTLVQGASVILGANVGGTVTVWLLALRLQQIIPLLLGAGALLNLFAQREPVKFSGELAFGVGLMFFALGLLESGFAMLLLDPAIAHGALRLGTDHWHVVLTALLGALLTTLVRSASAMVGVTMAAATVGLIDFAGGAALVLGANVGTTISAQLAASGATADSRRAALFHTLVNLLGAAVLLLGFRYWVAAVDLLVPGDPSAPAGFTRTGAALHIALAHTTFNVIMVALAWPLLTPLVRLVERLIGPSQRERPGLRDLRLSGAASPALALEQCRLEVLHMADAAGEALHLTQSLYRDASTPAADVRERILKTEKATDTMHHAIVVFMARVMSGVLTMAQSQEGRRLVRVADEIESVADYCERLANYRRRLVREGVMLSEAALGELQEYLHRTTALYEEIVDRARRNETGWLPAIKAKANYLATEADLLRDANLQRLGSARMSATAGIFFNDMLVAMRRIRNHSLNMAEAFVGAK